MKPSNVLKNGIIAYAGFTLALIFISNLMIPDLVDQESEFLYFLDKISNTYVANAAQEANSSSHPSALRITQLIIVILSPIGAFLLALFTYDRVDSEPILRPPRKGISLPFLLLGGVLIIAFPFLPTTVGNEFLVSQRISQATQHSRVFLGVWSEVLFLTFSFIWFYIFLFIFLKFRRS
jgi:hypothetical protein